jgi:hypothetical protein
MLSPFVPDSFINELLPKHRDRGRQSQFNATQLYRVHLLSVLSPVHTFNRLLALLPERKGWRQFAHLANRRNLSDVWMLDQFRSRAGVSGLRRINEHLLERLLTRRPSHRQAVGMIDATDLEAACSGYKKRPAASTPHNVPPSECAP